MHLTLRQFRYFMALVETGHFGRAAQMCNVSQPALSVQIRELEAALGMVLIERDSRELRLTLRGREVAARVARVLEEVRGIEELARRPGGLSGRLVLGVIPTVAPYLLPHALPLLRARDLMLELGVREAMTPALIEELRAGRLDAAVIALPSGQPDLVESPLFEDPFLLAVSRRKARDFAAPPTPADVDPAQLLLLD
ncbi:MAG: LysR family transcriptional regulator, partial [Alphaproteobacteria bacterium]